MKHLAAPLFVLAATLFSLRAQAADTLVVKNDGKLGPGIAKTWKAGADAVSFSLQAGADGNQIAKTINERLAGAKASFAGGELKIAGMPMDTLLEQLSHLSLSGEGDPLADLSGLGGAVAAMETPEAGGSIRASKPSGGKRTLSDPDPAERWEAQVLDVKRGGFPTVTLKLKVSKVGQKADAKTVQKGKTIEAPVVFAGDVNIDLKDSHTQRNIGAFYLSPGDKVTVHSVPTKDGKLELDFVERASAAAAPAPAPAK